MDSQVDLARAVSDALDELRKVVHAEDMHENGGLSADAAEFQRAWPKFTSAFECAADVMHDPEPGLGLFSIWSGSACAVAANIDSIFQEVRDGWNAVNSKAGDSLFDLVTTHWQTCNRTWKYRAKRPTRLAALASPARGPLVELREYAENQAQGKQVGRLSQSEIGTLILKCVNELLVADCWMRDPKFCSHILNYLDMPAGVPLFFRHDNCAEPTIRYIVKRLTGENLADDATAKVEGVGEPPIDIVVLEQQTARLNEKGVEWVSSRKAAEIEDVEVATLAKYRQLGLIMPDKLFGRDKEGRIWRKRSSSNAHPRYLRSSLLRDE